MLPLIVDSPKPEVSSSALITATSDGSDPRRWRRRSSPEPSRCYTPIAVVQIVVNAGDRDRLVAYSTTGCKRDAGWTHGAFSRVRAGQSDRHVCRRLRRQPDRERGSPPGSVVFLLMAETLNPAVSLSVFVTDTSLAFRPL